MRVIPTGTPVAKLREDRVIAYIQSGPTMLEVSLTPHEAMALAVSLQMCANQPVNWSRRQAEIIAFPTQRQRRAL